MLPAVKNVLHSISDKIIHIETLGCRLNQIESESAASFFSNDGFSVVMKSITSKEKENPNVLLAVVNTCTVTAKAEQKARRIIRLLLKKYPLAVLIVTGCYAQVNKEEIAAIDDRIVVLPGRIKSRLSNVPSLINKIISENNFDKVEFDSTDFFEKVLFALKKDLLSGEVGDTSEEPFKLSTDTFLHHSRSSIKIQDGCNNRCTYCEICIARGKSISLSVEEVLSRVNKLIESGHKEIVITTVNIAQYRGDYNGTKADFTTLLEVLLKNTKGVSFRISSLYPQIVDDRFCQVIKDERVRPHFHLSVQSGSDEILEKMNRPYKSDVVREACRKLKEVKGNPFLACDIIAGFPTETDEDFEKTMQLLKDCGFTFVHAFPFSPRPNTVAYSMKPKVAEFITGQRVQKLLNFAFEKKIEYINSIKNTKRKAIVETSHNAAKKYGTNTFNAVTDNFLHCAVELAPGLEIPPAGSEVVIEIIRPLEDEIKRNEELEAYARLW